MATESVTKADDMLADIPGWEDLLTQDASNQSALLGDGKSRDEWRRLRHAADNVETVIIDGLEAIGEIQWRACSDENNLPAAQTFSALGSLHANLSELLRKLRVIDGNARYCEHQVELKEAKSAR
ncbi:MAG: hypothetical protein ACRES9_00870 [Gammaproteobacteria bacterium]